MLTFFLMFMCGLLYLGGMFLSVMPFYNSYINHRSRKYKARFWLVSPVIVLFLPLFFVVKGLCTLLRDAFGKEDSDAQNNS